MSQSKKKRKREQSRVTAVVMAAGLGKRMRSSLPKVMHPVAGRPMVWYMARVAHRVADTTVVVVGHGGEAVRSYLEDEKESVGPCLIVTQTEQKGTGHAVLQARQILEHQISPVETCLILNGDTPLLTEQTIRALLLRHRRRKATVTLLTTLLEDPRGYGRVVRGKHNEVLYVVEDRDASKEERSIQEVNVGTYVVHTPFLLQALCSLRPNNAQQEYYLTDIAAIANKQGCRVSACVAPDQIETMGINTREHLSVAERQVREQICRYWMRAGVTLLDPRRTVIDAGVNIGKDTVLYPDVTLQGHTRVGNHSTIRSHSRLTDCTIGNHVHIQDSCVLDGAVVEEGAVIGPFAHLRPGATVCRQAKVGNFVELKQTTLGISSKANHLTYLGDTVVGREVNIGAGTITCNYDGYKKEQTVIEDHVFIGSDTQLIAPVRIGRGALIAAGTTVTQDIPPDALGIARTAQVNKQGVAARRRAVLAVPASGRASTPSRKRVQGTHRS